VREESGERVEGYVYPSEDHEAVVSSSDEDLSILRWHEGIEALFDVFGCQQSVVDRVGV
jgi:hypothetical protein